MRKATHKGKRCNGPTVPEGEASKMADAKREEGEEGEEGVVANS